LYFLQELDALFYIIKGFFIYKLIGLYNRTIKYINNHSLTHIKLELNLHLIDLKSGAMFYIPKVLIDQKLLTTGKQYKIIIEEE